MVGVQVRDHHRIEPSDSGSGERSTHQRHAWSRIDEHSVRAVTDKNRVALPDVEHLDDSAWRDRRPDCDQDHSYEKHS